MTTPTSETKIAARAGTETIDAPPDTAISSGRLDGISASSKSGGLSDGSLRASKSTFVVALVIFFLIDTLVRFNFHPDPYELPEHNYIWWAVKGFRELKQTPDILIFGSSLVLAATNNGDAAYLQQPLDAVLHHRSVCLEDGLSGRYHHPLKTYSFAIGGQMASDVYAIDKTLVDGKHRPKVVVWGIAPRDFIDAAFDGPYSSDTARYMNKIANEQVIPPAHQSIPSFIEAALSQVSALFKMRTDLLSSEQAFIRQTRPIRDKIPNQWSLNLACKHYKYGPELSQHLEIGDWIIPVCRSYTTKLKDNSAEYSLRYNPFKIKVLKEQLAYLEKFLRLNQEAGTRVVLLNMPLTNENMALMPKGVYDYYLSEIKRVADAYHADLFDFNNGVFFSRKEFADTVHLNGLGGEKLALLTCNFLGQRLKN